MASSIAAADPEDGVQVVPAKSKKKEKPPPEPTVSMGDLYQFASCTEIMMLIVGAFGAAAAGVAQPLMLLGFYGLFEQLGVGATIGGAMVSTDAMIDLLLIMVYVGAGCGVGNLLSTAIVEYVTASQMVKYKRAYLKAVLRQDVGWYDVSNPEELSTQFAEAMVTVQKGLKAQTGFFMGLGYGTGGLVLGFVPRYGQPEVAAVTLVTVPLLICAFGGVMYVVENGSKLVAAAYSQAGGIATECLFSMRTIAALGLEGTFRDRYAGSLSKVRRTQITNAALLMMFGGVALSSYLVMMAVAIVFGALRLAYELEASQFPMIRNDPTYGDIHYCADAAGQIANFSFNTPCATPYYMSCSIAGTVALAGDTPLTALAEASGFEVPAGYEDLTFLESLGFTTMSTFDAYVKSSSPSTYRDWNPEYYSCSMAGFNVIIAIFAVMMMGEGFGMSGAPYSHLTMARQAAAKVLAIINRIPTIDSFSDEGLKPSSVTGVIEVQNVEFAYPSAPGTLVCKGYSLSIPAGDTVALCGPSGSGKSTIIQLLERFYDPLSGSITLDGKDIKTLNVRWLRAQLGLVSQEPLLFVGSVADNIAYGMTSTGKQASQEEIEEAAKMANAHTFITTNLGDGYKTQVGQFGGKLSGGQKQRVAIARAIIKKPSVLLLDEATSALDTKSEKVVQAALEEIMVSLKRTTIVIAHRLSTIRTANKIAVLSEGAVAEEGTYDSLMTIEGGLFRGLAEKQEALLAQDRAAVAGGSGHGGKIEEEADPDAAVPEVKAEVVIDGKEAKKAAKVKEESAPIMRLLKMQAEQAPTHLLMAIFSGGAMALSTYSFYVMVFVMELILSPSPTQMRADAWHYSILLAIYAVAIILSMFFSGFFNGIAGSSLTAKLRSKGIAALMRQEMGFFDQEENSAMELTAFLSEKVDKIKTIITEQLDLIAQLIGAATMFIILIALFSDWRLLLAWLAFIGIMCVTMPIQVALVTGEDASEKAAKTGKEDTSKKTLASTSANKVVGECVMGIRTVASYNLEQRFYEDFAKSTGTVATYAKQDAIKGGLAIGFVQFVMFGSFGVIFYYSIWLANNGLADFRKVNVPMFTMMGLMLPMMKAGALADMKNASNAAIRLFKLFDRIPLIDNLSTAGQSPSSVTGAIEVKDVVFSYPTAADHMVCKGYSLSIPPGQTVALCGPSGSGKSTLINLLERFYDPISGSITLDGADLKSLNLRWLRAQLGLVGQEPVLFQGSVADNIAYGMTSTGKQASQEEIEEAAKMANAHTFITTNLGDGYKTDVGLKGGKLSGGQKQRVAIARAIIKKPSVLLLDEATSALDNESESIVQAALDEIMTKLKRTTIVIAHRLSTIRAADKIAVINEGKVVEEGTHDELLGMHGLYTNLVMAG